MQLDPLSKRFGIVLLLLTNKTTNRKTKAQATNNQQPTAQVSSVSNRVKGYSTVAKKYRSNIHMRPQNGNGKTNMQQRTGFK